MGRKITWKLLATGLVLFFIGASCCSCAEEGKPTAEQQLRISRWQQTFSSENWNPLCWDVAWDPESKQWIEGITVPPSPPPNHPELGKEANPDWPWLPGQKPPYPHSTYPGTPKPGVTRMWWDTELGEWHTQSE